MTAPEHEDLERLIRDSRWMRGLARRLVRDADLADDVVQDALVVAIEDRARVRGGMSNFLAGVIKRLASGVRRAEERRARREAATPPRRSGDGDVAELAARLEAQREVAAFLLALDEPYRATLLLRYVEDVKPSAIASRQGVPVATVNSRLARGLAVLREKLDRKHGDREIWVRALAPFVVPHSVFGTVVTGVTIMSMQQKMAALAAALVLFVGAGWWWSLHSKDDPEVSTSVAEAPRIGLEDTGGSTHDLAPISESMARHQVGVEVLRGETETFVHPCVVRVVRAEDGTPIEGAVVAFRQGGMICAEDRDVIGLRVTSGIAESIESIATMLPAARRTDERGEAEIEGKSRATLLVVKGDRAREFALDAKLSRAEIALEVSRSIDVTVVDDAGRRVVGIPVVLCVRDHESRLAPVVAVQADDRGMACFPVSLVDSQQMVSGALARNEQIVAAIGIPSIERQVVPVRLGGDEVELRVPSTASVRGHVRFDDGSDVPNGEVAFAAVIRDLRTTAPYAGAVVREGVIEFPWVPCGAELMLTAAFDGAPSFNSGWPANQRIHAPSSPGAFAEFDWVIPRARSIRARGRIVDSNGDSIAGEQLTIGLRQNLNQRIETDIDGSFAVDFAIRSTDPDPSPATPWPVVLYVWRDRQIELRSELRAPIGDSIIDLGTFTVEGPNVLAEGRVRDTQGNPVARASVMFVTRDSGSPDRWSPVPLFGFVRTDDDGRFVIRDAPARPDLYLAAANDYVEVHGTPIPFRAVRDLEIVVPARGRLIGKVLIDSSIHADRLRVHMWDESKGPQPELGTAGWVRTLGTVEPGGLVRGPEVSAGQYTVALSVSGLGSAIEYVNGVVINARDSRDPRFEPLDLRGRLRWLDLDVDDGEGNALNATVFALLRDGGLLQLGSSAKTIVFDRSQVIESVLVTATGYCGASLGDVDGDQRVRLTTGIEVSIEWPVGEMLPLSPAKAYARLTPTDLSTLPGGRRAAEFLFGGHEARAAFDEERIATVRVPAPGDYALEVYLEHDRDGYVDRAWVIEPRTPQVVSVVGSGAEFSVNAPAAAFEAARAKIESKH